MPDFQQEPAAHIDVQQGAAFSELSHEGARWSLEGITTYVDGHMRYLESLDPPYTDADEAVYELFGELREALTLLDENRGVYAPDGTSIAESIRATHDALLGCNYAFSLSGFPEFLEAHARQGIVNIQQHIKSATPYEVSHVSGVDAQRREKRSGLYQQLLLNANFIGDTQTFLPEETYLHQAKQRVADAFRAEEWLLTAVSDTSSADDLMQKINKVYDFMKRWQLKGISYAGFVSGCKKITTWDTRTVPQYEVVRDLYLCRELCVSLGTAKPTNFGRRIVDGRLSLRLSGWVEIFSLLEEPHLVADHPGQWAKRRVASLQANKTKTWGDLAGDITHVLMQYADIGNVPAWLQSETRRSLASIHDALVRYAAHDQERVAALFATVGACGEKLRPQDSSSPAASVLFFGGETP